MASPHLSAEEFRKMYLASLNQQIKNNEMNYQANLLFHQTGQPSAMEDTRNVTEKLADIESLKNKLRTDLLQITDRTNALQIINQINDPDEIQDFYQNFERIKEIIKPRYRAGVTAPEFMNFFNEFLKQKQLQISGAIKPVETSAVATSEFDQWLQVMKSDPERLPASKVRSFFARVKKDIDSQIRDTKTAPEQAKKLTEIKASFPQYRTDATAYKSWINENSELWQELIAILSTLTGKGIIGLGLGRNRPKKINTGVTEKVKYATMGRYLIDLDKLDEGVVQLKTPALKTVVGYPSRKVSKSVTAVVKKIVGGELPSYEDIETLNNEDRLYMNKLSKVSRIDDRIKIPSPNKDAESKEAQEFEILRGSIIAGNDNAGLVKKFKGMIIKFSNDGRLPKGQAKEILMELAMLGL